MILELKSANPSRQHAFVEVDRIDGNGNKQTWKYYSNIAVGTVDGVKTNGQPKIKPFVYVDRGDGNGLVKFIPTHPHGAWHTETAIGEIINQDNNNYGRPHEKMRLFSKNSPCVGMCLQGMMQFRNAELKIAFDDFYDKYDKKSKKRITEESDFRKKINNQLSLDNNKVQFYQFGGKNHLMYSNFVFVFNLKVFVGNGNMNGIVEFEPSTSGAATSKPLISPGVCGNSANNRRKVCK